MTPTLPLPQTRASALDVPGNSGQAHRGLELSQWAVGAARAGACGHRNAGWGCLSAAAWSVVAGGRERARTSPGWGEGLRTWSP